MLQGSVRPTLPLWVRHRIDDEAIEHYLSIGEFVPAEDREALTVALVQRDDLGPDGDPAVVERQPAQVRMAGVRLSRDEAVRLAGLLGAAVAVINRAAQPQAAQPQAAQPQAAQPKSATPRVLRSFNGGYGLAPVSSARAVHPARRSA
jgi:hypothetical protein